MPHPLATKLPRLRLLKIAAVSSVLVIASLSAHADECTSDPGPDADTTVDNRDGSALELKRSGCEVEVVLSANGKRSSPLRLDISYGTVSFIDVNDDGNFEVEDREGCGIVNCNVTIYAIDPVTRQSRTVLSYDGSGLHKVGRYLVSGVRNGAADHSFSGYRVIDAARLNIRQDASFEGQETAFGEKPICKIHLRERGLRKEIAAIAGDLCSPDARIEINAR